MTDFRKALREKVAEVLKGYPTEAGDRVFPARAREVWDDALPAIVVWISRTTYEVDSIEPRVYKATFTVEVELIVADVYDPNTKKLATSKEDGLDALSEQVEVALLTDPTLSDLVADSNVTNSTVGFFEGARREVGVETKTLEATVYLELGDEDGGDLAPLKIVRHKIDIPGGNVPDSDQEVDIPQT